MNSYCDARRRDGTTCPHPAAYVVGAAGLDSLEPRARSACERHLGKIVRAQIDRIALADGIVAVARYPVRTD